MRIIIVLRPRQFYGVPLECYYHASEKCYLCKSWWYDDGFMVILVVKYPKTYVPLEGLRRQCQ
nr:hypothetical protein SOLLY_220 [Escherichia phage vB_Eco_Solly]